MNEPLQFGRACRLGVIMQDCLCFFQHPTERQTDQETENEMHDTIWNDTRMVYQTGTPCLFFNPAGFLVMLDSEWLFFPAKAILFFFFLCLLFSCFSWWNLLEQMTCMRS
jgi:hypothetical protein